MTVVNVTLAPAIGARFGAEPVALSWVVTGYTLGGGLLLSGGRLTDRWGRWRAAGNSSRQRDGAVSKIHGDIACRSPAG
ncbi:hypothetical protein JQK87_11185 [Streptomyces sp. G44]|nr:hypothetical protein [Streptomyces sp. G44]